jgi:hypothetical protein
MSMSTVHSSELYKITKVSEEWRKEGNKEKKNEENHSRHHVPNINQYFINHNNIF